MTIVPNCQPWIALDKVSKQFGGFEALRSVSFAVAPGQIVGLLGPNGAGKTTTLKIVMGMLAPTSGKATIRNLDCLADRVATKRHVGYLPDTPTFYDYLTGREYLHFVGRMHGLKPEPLQQRTEMLLTELLLIEAANDFVSSFSLGMKKKLGLAGALIHDPEVLVLDEPTTGLDPHAARHIHRLIVTYAESGRSVLLSTHQLAMAEGLCTDIVIVDHGKVVASGSVDEVRAEMQEGSSLEDLFFSVTREEL